MQIILATCLFRSLIFSKNIRILNCLHPDPYSILSKNSNVIWRRISASFWMLGAPDQVAYFVLLCYVTCWLFCCCSQPFFSAIMWVVLERKHPTLGHLHSGNVVILTNIIFNLQLYGFWFVDQGERRAALLWSVAVLTLFIITCRRLIRCYVTGASTSILWYDDCLQPCMHA